MIKAYFKEGKTINWVELEAPIQSNEIDQFVWVDLIDSSPEERKMVELAFNIELFTKQEAEEIESSSKYSEFENEIYINSNFTMNSGSDFRNEAVSFILKDDVLFTQRMVNLRSFDDALRKNRLAAEFSGSRLLITIFENRIDFDADLLENIAKEISDMSRALSVDRNLDEHLLIRINSYQETMMLLRENIVDKQRIISSIIKSTAFPKDEIDKVRVMIKDINSLLDHTAFTFERLEYLQNTFLGLLDLEQNKIIKIFTVVTVVFSPPMLIASLYGMNFTHMPELSHQWGYPMALLLMILSSAATLLFFKRKKWL